MAAFHSGTNEDNEESNLIAADKKIKFRRNRMHHLVEKFKAKTWFVYISLISGTELKEYCI